MRAGLAQFYNGCDNLYKHWLLPGGYSDGVKYLAEKAQCYWLIDAIASWQGSRKLRNSRMREGFQIWELRRVKGSEFVLLGSWDTDKIVIQQKIEYSDFPLDYIKLYYENQLLCLPDER